jgi:membrane associated rhomboid family serine protease
MYILFENLTRKQADICTLVLSASGLSHRISQDINGWSVWVDTAYYQQARKVMLDYFNENQEKPDSYEEEDIKVQRDSIISSLLVAAALLACHIGVMFSSSSREIINRFGASAANILDGEYFRTVSALMLHSDEVHLAGNMVGIFIFGTAVSSVAGWGLGWLMILLSGTFGNLVNAIMYESAHVSIGASTAVFGAIGILTGYQILKIRKKKGAIRAWIPLACGLALLGLLGSGGVRVDIMAHLFGFCCGIFFGLFYALVFKEKAGKIYQFTFYIIFLTVAVLSWYLE